jgi:hypothetical protein
VAGRDREPKSISAAAAAVAADTAEVS